VKPTAAQIVVNEAKLKAKRAAWRRRTRRPLMLVDLEKQQRKALAYLWRVEFVRARWCRFVTTLVCLTAAVVVPSAPVSAIPITYREPVRTAVNNLPVAAEVRTGYDRDKFVHWWDGDDDGCDTRAEVLIAESAIPATVASGCRVIRGHWHSYYDRATWTNPSDVDIDHVVALAEAWHSGALSWTGKQRRSYANDLGDGRTLVAITDSVNQSKGDRDPSDWLPPRRDAVCQYVRQWVVVKVRWRLTVDAREKDVLRFLATGCPNSVITVRRAR
jgi:hypothetical protein